MIKIKNINSNFELTITEAGEIDSSAKTIVSRKKFITKTVSEANIEDKDEYLKIKEIIIHVKINNRLKWKDKAIKIPKYVATPFPPLNFSHNGKRWPRKDAKADNWKNSGKKYRVILTGA